ncbi:MAG: hypothetical protein WCS20_17780 [Alphaproteobacteria bacterium]
MSFAIPSRTSRGLALSISGGAVAASLVSVVLIFLLPGDSSSLDQALPQTGPLGRLISDIVPFVWVGLFAALGAAYWLVAAGRTSPGTAGLALLGLILLCMVYPVLASNVANPVISITGNGVTVLAALLTARLTFATSKLAALAPLLVALWVSLATAGLFAVLFGWAF